jgi:hypothetical protein
VAAAGLAYGAVVTAERPAPSAGGGTRGGAPRPAPRPAKPASSFASDATEIEWARLTGYEYEPGLERLPDSIRALHGTKVVLGGFLLPLYEYDDIKEFFLVASHMSCCFGIPAGLNGQVYVKVKGDRGLPNTSEPLRVTGTFHAREVKEAGFTLTIWSILDAEVRIVGY